MPTPPSLKRDIILPETNLPVVDELVQQAREPGFIVGPCAFLSHYRVDSEYRYKQNQSDDRRIMLHAQIGYRSLKQSIYAYQEIHNRIQDHGYRLDRYGICLDWSMGFPFDQREKRPTGTGLILDHPDQFARLTESAPVAPHFGDFVMGMPAAFESTRHALGAGATSIGNLGQYFTFRLPDYDDDVLITAETIKAITLCANQPQPVLIHSNLDDGFAALFSDMSCALGAVMVEQYIVEDLLGGCLSHCYGHTYSDPLNRLAFMLALAKISNHPGTMVYGNTTRYTEELAGNYASLATYLGVDIQAQRSTWSGHAINPVPVTEALRIPTIEEVVEVHLFANRLIESSAAMELLQQHDSAGEVADNIIEGADVFKSNLLKGFEKAGIDIHNPFEILLALRRVGARDLEQLYGPGDTDEAGVRHPVVESTTLRDLRSQAHRIVGSIETVVRERVANLDISICTVTTDVHEYGKILMEKILDEMGLSFVDAGVSTDADDLLEIISKSNIDVIAISTYNGIALSYLETLTEGLKQRDLDHIPIYIGGKLNQVSASEIGKDLPVDISDKLNALGSIPCGSIQEMVLNIDQRFLTENNHH